MSSKLLLFILGFSLALVSCVQQEAVKTANQSNDTVAPTCDLSGLDESLSDPQSIEELVTLINSLPKPLTGECLVKSLKRPLYVNATASKLSAQPAGSYGSPRIFIFKGDLIISVVGTGEGSKLLEFSEVVSPTKSIKGEVVLPIENELARTDPFVRINISNRTTCSGCHGSEQLVNTIDGVAVYSSIAFRPFPQDDVSVEYLRENHYLCQSQKNTSQNCNFLKGLFSYGEVHAKAFPETMSLPQNMFGL